MVLIIPWLQIQAKQRKYASDAERSAIGPMAWPEAAFLAGAVNCARLALSLANIGQGFSCDPDLQSDCRLPFEFVRLQSL